MTDWVKFARQANTAAAGRIPRTSDLGEEAEPSQGARTLWTLAKDHMPQSLVALVPDYPVSFHGGIGPEQWDQARSELRCPGIQWDDPTGYKLRGLLSASIPEQLCNVELAFHLMGNPGRVPPQWFDAMAEAGSDWAYVCYWGTRITTLNTEHVLTTVINRHSRNLTLELLCLEKKFGIDAPAAIQSPEIRERDDD